MKVKPGLILATTIVAGVVENELALIQKLGFSETTTSYIKLIGAVCGFIGFYLQKPPSFNKLNDEDDDLRAYNSPAKIDEVDIIGKRPNGRK